MTQLNKNRIFVFFIVSVTVGILSLIPNAYASILNGNFGGKILDKKSCECSFSTLLTVGLPAPDHVMKTPFTRVYDYDHLEEGSWVLGHASLIPVPCIELVPTLTPPFVKCESNDAGFEIDRIGTSH